MFDFKILEIISIVNNKIEIFVNKNLLSKKPHSVQEVDENFSCNYFMILPSWILFFSEFLGITKSILIYL